jgi:hypothetical protein
MYRTGNWTTDIMHPSPSFAPVASFIQCLHCFCYLFAFLVYAFRYEPVRLSALNMITPSGNPLPNALTTIAKRSSAIQCQQGIIEKPNMRHVLPNSTIMRRP